MSMPLPDERSRPSASSLIKRFEAFTASHEPTSAPSPNRTPNLGTGSAKRIWSPTTSTTPTFAGSPRATPPISPSVSRLNTSPLDSSSTELDFSSSSLATCSNSSPQLPSGLTITSDESTTILFPGSLQTDPSSSPSSNLLPPIITQSTLEPEDELVTVEAVPGSADALLASPSLAFHPTTLSELVAGPRSGHHSKSPSIDSTSSRVSHEGLSQPSSPGVDGRRLSVPPVRGDASPPPTDIANSPVEDKTFTFPETPMLNEKEGEAKVEKREDTEVVPENTLPVDSSPPITPKSATPQPFVRSKSSSSPPIRRTVPPSSTTPKIRPSLTQPTASSLAKARSVAAVSPPTSPKIGSKQNSPVATTGMGPRPRASTSLMGLNKRDGVSPTPSTASRLSALDGRSKTPSTPNKPPTVSNPRTPQGRIRGSTISNVNTSTTTTTTTTPVRTSTKLSSTSPTTTLTPARTKTPIRKNSTSPAEGRKTPVREGNLKLASKGRIGLAGAPRATPAPSPPSLPKTDLTVSPDEPLKKEREEEPPAEEDIPDIPSDGDEENERVFDPVKLQGGRPFPGRIGIPIDVETGKAVASEQVEAA